MEEAIVRSYYAVIPADVRYDARLQSGAKLLYGEISSLCNEKGYCWAGNDYFASLYQTSERTIIRWINSLADLGYIRRELEYYPGTKTIKKRYLIIGNMTHEECFQMSPGCDKNVTTCTDKNVTPCGDKNVTDNNKYINNKINNNIYSTLVTNDTTKSEAEKSQKKKDVKHKYGSYENVLLSDTEIEKLKAEFPDDWQQWIERVSEYVASSGKSYKSYLATIRNWARRDREKNPKRKVSEFYKSLEIY